VLARSNPRNTGATPRITARNRLEPAQHCSKPAGAAALLPICGDTLGHLIGQISIADNHCTAMDLIRYCASIPKCPPPLSRFELLP